MSPFFSEKLGDFVVNSVCGCGHLETEHGSLLVGGIKVENHGGSCCKGRCGCEKFTWERWATTEEAAAITKSKRDLIPQ